MKVQSKKDLYEIYKTQFNFMTFIDECLHGDPISVGFYNSYIMMMRNLDTIKTMIEIYPEVLTTQDEYGWLTIHYATEKCLFADNINQKEVFIPLLTS